MSAMYIPELTTHLHQVLPLVQQIAAKDALTFDETWSLVCFYEKYKHTDDFIASVENVLPQETYSLLHDAMALKQETEGLIQLYYQNKEELASYTTETVFDAHLQPYKDNYQAAQEISAAAYKAYKELDNNLDIPEARYREAELPALWKQHAHLKAKADECSQKVKELYAIFERERTRILPLLRFKLSAFVMMVYSLDAMVEALIADLKEQNEKGGE